MADLDDCLMASLALTSCAAGKAAGIALAMLAASLLETLGQAHYLNNMLKIGMNLRVSPRVGLSSMSSACGPSAPGMQLTALLQYPLQILQAGQLASEHASKPASEQNQSLTQQAVLQSSLTDQLFGKVLRLTAAAQLARGTGAIVNLQSNDVHKIFWLPVHGIQLVLVPLQVHTPPPADAAADMPTARPVHMTMPSEALVGCP